MHGGTKQKDVAEILEVPVSSVSNIWQRFLKRGTSENAPRQGRPSPTTERDRRRLLRIVEKDKRASLADITSEWNANVSKSTVRRVLHGLGVNNYKGEWRRKDNKNRMKS